MKLKAIQIDEHTRIPEMPFKMFSGEQYDLTLNESTGMVAIVRKDRDDVYLVHVSKLSYARVEKAAPKK